MSPEDKLNPDEIFDILSNRRRRTLIRFLANNGGSASLGSIADHIAAVETGNQTEQLDTQDRRRVYISLYQSHVPKLVDHDIVTFDREKTIRLTDHVDPLMIYLTLEEPAPTRRIIQFLSMGSLVCTGLSLGVILDLIPVPIVRSDTVLLLTLSGIAVIHLVLIWLVHDDTRLT